MRVYNYINRGEGLQSNKTHAARIPELTVQHLEHFSRALISSLVLSPSFS